MNFARLLEITSDLPLIETTALRAMGEDRSQLSVQLSRWVESGKLIRLRRGAYLLAEPYRRRLPALETIANLLVTPSYVSFERALAYYGMIPETVNLVQSVTSARPIRLETPIGDFEYRHVTPSRFFGYRQTAFGIDQALVAVPEKALLDIAYLSKGEMTADRIEAMRLQNVDRLDIGRLLVLAERTGSPRLVRAAEQLEQWSHGERNREVVL